MVMYTMQNFNKCSIVVAHINNVCTLLQVAVLGRYGYALVTLPQPTMITNSCYCQTNSSYHDLPTLEDSMKYSGILYLPEGTQDKA